jgi:methylated-DNA-[protein]-cysteine S-methyltransferase
MKIKIIKHTPFGNVGIVWSVIRDFPKIVRVVLSQPGCSAENQLAATCPKLPANSCSEIDAVACDIKALLEGADIQIPITITDLDSCPAFQQSVLRITHKIPRGSISTYKLIADKLSKPGGARAVGNALANNPVPIIVPCHRAICSDGSLGGYQGGPRMKHRLLKMEGVHIPLRQARNNAVWQT